MPLWHLELIEQISAREGFGAELALGSYHFAEKVGGSAPIRIHGQKLEAPMHDPRAYHGLGLAYATSIRGACHVSGLCMHAEQGQVSLEEIGLEESYDGQSSAGKAKLVALAQDYGMAFGTAGIVCLLGMVYAVSDFIDALCAVTGRNWTIAEILACGRRNWMLKHAINLLRGARAPEDKLPDLLVTPLTEGGAAGSTPDMALMLREYYALRGFDAEGYPSREGLAELGLDDLYAYLQQHR